MRILLTGASGFIGAALADALAARGHALTLAVRDPVAATRRLPGHAAIAVDFARDLDIADWRGRVLGMDVVVNAVGIFREHRGQSFEAIHVRAPGALFAACAEAGVRRVVQLSALGADAGAASAYHRGKRAADALLAASGLEAVSVRPSLVFAPDGASASWFLALASLPVLPLPDGGGQCLQPIHRDDLVAALVALVERGAHAPVVDAVGPAPTTLRDYLATLRRALGLGSAWRPRLPRWIARMTASAAGRLPGSLLDADSLAMLERGNCAPADGITRVLGRAPRSPAAFIAPADASRLRRAAQLRWLLPMLRGSVALTWIVTGVVSLWVFPREDSLALLGRTGLEDAAAVAALHGAAWLDIALGVATLLLGHRRALYALQGLVIFGYTAIITVALPEYWAHPYGPVLKNLPLLAALWLLHALDGGERR